jgi:L-iditol 2-dehydrogenase
MSCINRRVYLDAEHRFTLKEEPVPQPRDDEVLVKIVANGICGSDLNFFNEGRLGNFVVTKPYVPGHEASGIIEAVGSKVQGISLGDHVVIEPGIPCGRCHYCRIGRYNLCEEVVFLSAPPINGTFCDYVSVRWDSVHMIPNEMHFEHGALVEPAAVAVHAVNRARFYNGGTAVIVGAGPIGLLTLQAFKAAGGAKVTCIDKMAKRLELAKKLGADEVIDTTRDGSELYDIADVAFETAGSAQATATLFELARPGGCVVQVGWPGGNIVDMNIARFIDKELDYVAVNRYANAFSTAISWISDGRINVEELITHTYSLSEIEEAFKFTLANPAEAVKTVVVN